MLDAIRSQETTFLRVLCGFVRKKDLNQCLHRLLNLRTGEADVGHCMRRRNKLIAGVSLATVLYVFVYAVNSLLGGYTDTQTGNLRIGISLDDALFWMPRYGWAQRYTWSGGERTVRADGLGYLFLPLILIDQAYWHRTIIYIGKDANVEDFKDHLTPQTLHLHPIHHREEILALKDQDAQQDAGSASDTQTVRNGTPQQ